jgi:ATP-dependent Clp protease adapter protein ClpS
MRTPEVDAILVRAEALASGWNHAGPAVEHVLIATLEEPQARKILRDAGGDVDALQRDLVPLVRYLVVNVRPNLAPWIETIEAKTNRGGSATTPGMLLAEILAATHSAAVMVVLQRVRRVDVLNVVAHGIVKAETSPLPRAWLVRGGSEKPGGRYRVVMHDDMYTTYGVVTEIVVARFDKSKAEAAELAARAHADGRVVVGTYPLKVASKKVAQATAFARALGYPLRLSVEPDD